MRLALLALVACGNNSVVTDAGDAGSSSMPDTFVPDADVVDAAMDAPPMKCALAMSGPVVAMSDGQIIEKLHVIVNGKPGIDIDGKKNVIVRNV